MDFLIEPIVYSGPDWLIKLFVVIVGLLAGSFANVLIHRLPQKKSIVSPRSACPKCNKMISWWENIPLLSFLFLGGKCSNCKTKISLRYPIVEMLVALLFLATLFRFGLSPMLFLRDWPLMVILVAITFIDLEHRIIPDSLSLGGLAIGLATGWIIPDLGWQGSFFGAFLGFGLFYFFAWGYYKLSGRSGLGGGDIKLLAMLGAFVGAQGVFVVVLVSSVLGSVIGILWAIIGRKKKIMKVSIPYGPFLVLGGLYIYLIGDLLWHPFMIPM